MNYNSIVPTSWKFGLIYGMLNMAWSICSSRELFNAEIVKLRKMFMSNGYPICVFEKIHQKFILSREQEKM